MIKCYGTLTLLAVGMMLIGCQANPEPLNFGKDACHACKMTLVDRKFGAEIVTKKGKVYKFDDIGCMIDFCQSGNEPTDNISQYLVVNFAGPEELINAETAFYVRSESIRSPMASHVAAFLTAEQRDQHSNGQGTTIITWKDLPRERK